MSSATRRDVLKLGTTAAFTALSPGLLLGQEKPAAPVKKPAPKEDPYKDAVFQAGPPPMPAKGSFTIAVLPDTQMYCQSVPEGFYAQTQWLVDHKEDRNIAAVLHLGDITNRNTPDQWEIAQKAMRQLDGHIPYFMVCGNHDYGQGGGCADRTTHFNEYFPLKHYSDLKTFGGVYDKEPDRFENSYHTFTAGGKKFLVVALEFGPRNDVVRWANEVVGKHKDHAAILITHAFIYYDETRYDWKKYGMKQTWNPHNYRIAKATNDDINDGEELWNKLVSPNGNFLMTLNGHVLNDGLGRVTTKDAKQRDVAQMLVNFQMKPKGGDGWMRLLEFKADGVTVDVIDYSPTRNECNVSWQNKFSLTLPA
jgi:predicted phosphodiesterase